MSTLPEIQEQVRRLQGVRHARIVWPAQDGPATLHVEFAREADEESTTGEVLRILQQVGKVRPEDIEITGRPLPLPPPPRAAAEREDEPIAEAPLTGEAVHDRPIFSRLTIERDGQQLHIEVALRVGSHDHAASASGRVGQHTEAEVAGRAVVEVLNRLYGAHGHVSLQRLEIRPVDADHDCVVASLFVFDSTGNGPQTLIGAAAVAGDERESAVRAVLDAVNRRLERLTPSSRTVTLPA